MKNYEKIFKINAIFLNKEWLIEKEFPTKYLDASDGLAVAVCHHFNSGNLTADKSYTGWDSFLKQNPDRLK